MTDNTQAELENLIRNNIHTFADEYLELDECVAALTAYTNKQIEAVLDRLEDEKRYTNDTTFLQYDLVVVPLSAIEAERSKLKESSDG